MIILSMKASNPKVMIQAYCLVVAMMEEEKYDTCHLGVTEVLMGKMWPEKVQSNQIILDVWVTPSGCLLRKIQCLRSPWLRTE